MAGKKTANLEIKKINRTNTYQLLRRNDALTRQDMVRSLQLCLPTVTQNLAAMQAEGLVVESGSVGNTGGRRAKAYSIVRDARTALGVDITKHHIAVVAVDLTGEVIGQVRVRCDFSRTTAYYKKLGNMVEMVIKDTGLDRARILGVGIGVPGLISADNQTVFFGEILDFTGATCAEFSRYIPFPTAFYNDANAAGFAEIWERRDIKNAFYIMLSNNIGGSVLINNQVYSGEHIRGGEVGHMTIVPNGKHCYCGQIGCVDPYCAATVLSDATDGNIERFFDLLKLGDKAAKKAWKTYLYYLSITVNNLRMLFDCPIILGGYVGALMDDYLDELKKISASRNTFEQNADYLEVCQYKVESIAAGAALPFIDGFIRTI